MLHKSVGLGERHPIHNWEPANAAALAALSVVSGDIGQVAKQLDTGKFYILTSVGPNVWTLMQTGAASDLTDGTNVARRNAANTFTAKNSLQNYDEKIGTYTLSAGVLTCDLATGNTFNISLNGNVTSLVFSNAPAANYAVGVLLYLKQDATGGRTISFGTFVKWGSAGAPTFSTAANALDIISMTSVDQCTTMQAYTGGLGY